MDEKSFGTSDNPLIEIARAIGRIEASISVFTTRQTDHESRISDLEEEQTKFKAYAVSAAAIFSTLAAVGSWMVEHFWK